MRRPALVSFPVSQEWFCVAEAARSGAIPPGATGRRAVTALAVNIVDASGASFICVVFMLEGIGETKGHKDRAAQIQRGLFPIQVLGVSAEILELRARAGAPHGGLTDKQPNQRH